MGAESVQSQTEEDLVGSITESYLELLSRDQGIAAPFLVRQELAARVREEDLNPSTALKVFEQLGINPPEDMASSVK